MGTGTRVEARERTWDGKGDGSRDGNESSSGDGNGDEDGDGDEDRIGNDDGNGNEDRIGEGGGEAEKRKKPHKSCRRHVGNGKIWVERGTHVEKKGLVQ